MSTGILTAVVDFHHRDDVDGLKRQGRKQYRRISLIDCFTECGRNGPSVSLSGKGAG